MKSKNAGKLIDVVIGVVYKKDVWLMSKRKSNLELLRIISMILIVMSHCDEIFGLSNLYSQTLGIGKIINDWLNMGG